jgi:hypothetical protein
MRAGRWMAVLGFVPLLCATAPPPAAWVPVRWPWSDASSLELLTGTPVNCLLLKTYTPEFIAAAQARGIVALPVVTAVGDIERAVAAKPDAIVLEGDFPDATVAAIKNVPVIEMAARNRLRLGGAAAVLATNQGVWPGISADDEGAKKSGPTSGPWIDTNTGFLRGVRAWGNPVVWIANLPPPKSVVATTRYLQAIADAATSGARWVVAFDDDLAPRLAAREEAAMGTWKRIAGLLAYFEQHPEWRDLPEGGQLALVQDPAKGGLLSGGILDMIAVKHTPVRPIARQQLSPAALAGATMAVNVDAAALTPEQKEILRGFTRGGGTLLSGPPGWQDPTPAAGKITLDKADLERVNDIWHDVNAMIGRRNLGVRLFNVASMLSNYLAAADGKTAIVHLVNYSDYPVENVAMHFTGEFKHATLMGPDLAAKPLEIYKTEEGWGVDVDRVGVCATVKLEQ